MTPHAAPPMALGLTEGQTQNFLSTPSHFPLGMESDDALIHHPQHGHWVNSGLPQNLSLASALGSKYPPPSLLEAVISSLSSVFFISSP